MKTKVVIFDFDGTIADTMYKGIELYNSICDKFNTRKVMPEEIENLRGSRPQDFLKSYGISYFKLPLLIFEIRRLLKKRYFEYKTNSGNI